MPDGEFVGTVSLTYHAWDQTAGAAGGTAKLTPGVRGTTAFRAVSEVAVLKVATTMTPVPEDSRAPKGDAAGGLIPACITAADVSFKNGMAVVGVTGSENGTWQFSVKKGRTWKALTAAADAVGDALGVAVTGVTGKGGVALPGRRRGELARPRRRGCWGRTTAFDSCLWALRPASPS